MAVPASEKTTLIQYKFDAIGHRWVNRWAQVKIELTGPDSFRVEFIGIGFDDPVFEDPLESSNALSWLTPSAVQTHMVNNILSDENKQKFIKTQKH